MNLKKLIKDRDLLLSHIDSPDYEEIRKYCNKYKIPMPSQSISILAGLHKARLYVVSDLITDEMKEKSKNWLEANGFSCEIK